MRVRIEAVHKHDSWSSIGRSLIGKTGTANWLAKTPGVPGWFGMDFSSDTPIEVLGILGRSNFIFFSVKYTELPDEPAE